jgi:poly-gamma-glutamate synthase PgsB/CapB
MQHQRLLKKIPYRIHVNGTRGKSSVTRLIGAGLRAGGFSTLTKVTGTFPRMIEPDGSEVAIFRKEKANILEQLNIVKYAAHKKVDVLLIECMALQPQYQKITERQMVRATHGIITNIRLDHLDVMGPGIEEVAEALSGTVPHKAKLFTSEDRMTNFLERKAKQHKTELFVADKSTVTNEEMQGFTYLEHPENVALALDVCAEMNIDRALALKAMKHTIPDEGALQRFTMQEDGKKIVFYNALAANDPESSMMIWQQVRRQEGASKQYFILINARKDRKERSEQLLGMSTQCTFDQLLLTGENVELVKQMALKAGLDKDKIVCIGQKDPSDQVEQMLPLIAKECVVVAFGNMGAGGSELSKYFELKHS